MRPAGASRCAAAAAAALALAALPAAEAFAGGTRLPVPGRVLAQPCTCPVSLPRQLPLTMVSTDAGLVKHRGETRFAGVVAQVGGMPRVSQMLVRTALSFVFVLGALGVLRPASANAAGGADATAQEPAAHVRSSASDAVTPSATTRHGHRLAFAGPAQESVSARTAAFVSAPNKEWKGLFGHLKLGEKLSASTSDYTQWMQFKFYELLASNGAVKLFIFSAFSVSLVVIGGWMLRIANGGEDISWDEALFKAYSLLNNVAGTSAVDEEKGSMAVVANLLFITGLLTFAILLGLVTSTFESGLDNALAGAHRVVAKEHVVMLNWNEKSPAMLKQMEAAVIDGRMSSSTPVVVLGQKDKEEMDAEVAEVLTTNRLKVYTRSGNPAVFSDLEIASVGDAKHILLVSPGETGEGDVTPPGERVLVQTSAVQALEADRQPGKKVGLSQKDIKMVVAGFGATELDSSALPGVTVMPRGDFSSRLLAAATSQKGLGSVYKEIFDQGDGCELYLRSQDKYPWLQGKTFKELSAHFPESVVLGWTDCEAGEIVMNPAPNTKLPEGKSKRIVLLSRSANIRCTRAPTSYTTAEGRSWKPATKHLTPSVYSVAKQRVVVLDDAKTEGVLLENMASFLAPGSHITTLSNEVSKANTGRVSSKHIAGSSLSLSAVAMTHPETADIILIRSVGSEISAQERDGRVLAKARLVLISRSSHTTLKPLRIVAQVQNDETSEKLQHLVDELGDDGVSLETIDTAQLTAGAIVQVLWNPELKNVFTDLMDSDGSEISLMDASFFAPPGQTRSFADITQLALEKKAVPLGFLRADGALELSPAAKEMIKLNPGDKVVVFADTC